MICDILGEEIFVGSLIAFTRGNEMNLAVGIVSEIHKDRINYPIKTVLPEKFYALSSKKRISFKIRKGYIKLEQGLTNQNRIVVIKNPLFLITNDNISQQLEIADMAIEAGVLPKGYQLGTPF